jgi:2-iminobutanoate/2-iminopropanoate deaminase
MAPSSLSTAIFISIGYYRHGFCRAMQNCRIAANLLHSFLLKSAFMSKQIIQTDAAPAPIGPYNQAVLAGDLLFISGQIAINPADGSMNNASVEDETHQVMHNLKAILQKAGLGFEHVVKTTIFLSDMALFGAVNEIYGKYFKGDFPARETVAVKGLPKNVNVEISMIASR